MAETTITSRVGRMGEDVKKEITIETAFKKQQEKELAEYRKKLSKQLNLDSAEQQEELTRRLELKKAEYAEELRELAYYEELEEAKNLEKRVAEYRKKLQKENMSSLQKAFSNIATNFGKVAYKALSSGIEESVDIYSKYFTEFSTRLQESGYRATDIFDLARSKASSSPYYKMTTLLENVSKLVEAGITDNITQRAFLASISDKIANTFDVTSKSLLEIVRIQKQDTTASRLGLEAKLTQLFNEYFGDTSYLSEQFDNVQNILIGSSAQMTAQQSIAYEYQVQKWLGALGAVGVSEGTLQQIAEGINYLGTGNITALSSNQALQNLLVLASQRGGVSYTDILSRGMSAEDANRLLYGLVDYVRSISGSNVVRAQYADLFGITLTDMKVIQDMSVDTLKSLTQSAMTYNDTLNELNYQLTQVSSRMHISEMIDNVLSNIMTSTGMTIAEVAPLYLTYKVADMIESVTGGIPISSLSYLGTGIDFEGLTYEQAIKTGVMGLGLLGPLMGSIANLTSGGSLNLASYAIERSGGQGFRRGSQGLNVTTSGTSYMFNEDKSGTQQALYSQQEAQAQEVSGKGEEENSLDRIEVLVQALVNYFKNNESISSPLYVVVQDLDTNAANKIAQQYY